MPRKHPTPPKPLLGRDRNKVKFTKWCFYVKDCKKPQNFMKSLMEVASIQKARVPGQKLQPLVLEKVSNNKVEVAYPLPVSADTCTRFLKLALGAKWRKFVTDLAGAQGAHQEVGTAEEEVVVAEAAGEEIDEAAIEAALLDDAPVSRGAFGSAAGPFSPRPRQFAPLVREGSPRALQQPRPAVVSICSH